MHVASSVQTHPCWSLKSDVCGRWLSPNLGNISWFLLRRLVYFPIKNLEILIFSIVSVMTFASRHSSAGKSHQPLWDRHRNNTEKQLSVMRSIKIHWYNKLSSPWRILLPIEKTKHGSWHHRTSLLILTVCRPRQKSLRALWPTSLELGNEFVFGSWWAGSVCCLYPPKKNALLKEISDFFEDYFWSLGPISLTRATSCCWQSSADTISLCFPLYYDVYESLQIQTVPRTADGWPIVVRGTLSAIKLWA